MDICHHCGCLRGYSGCFNCQEFGCDFCTKKADSEIFHPASGQYILSCIGCSSKFDTAFSGDPCDPELKAVLEDVIRGKVDLRKVKDSTGDSEEKEYIILCVVCQSKMADDFRGWNKSPRDRISKDCTITYPEDYFEGENLWTCKTCSEKHMIKASGPMMLHIIHS